MVRPARSGDGPRLADIHITSWQSTYRGVFDAEFLEGLDRGSRAVWFEDQILAGASIFVEPEGDPFGFCWYGEPFAAQPEEGWAELYSIYVFPDHWGAGHGYRLLEQAQIEMARAGYARAFLWVLDSNERARVFYGRQGWKLAKPLKIEEIGGTQITEVRYEVEL